MIMQVNLMAHGSNLVIPVALENDGMKSIMNGLNHYVHDIQDFTIAKWVGGNAFDWITNGFTAWFTNYITVLPTLAVVCLCFYCLFGMFSKKLAHASTVVVLLYGAILAI